MNETSKGFGAMPDGVSAASTGELDQIEGGQTSQTTMGPWKPYIDGTAAGYWALVKWLQAQK